MIQPHELGEGSLKVFNSGLHVDCMEIIDRMLLVSPMDFTLVSGFRTANEQFDLYQIGRKFDAMKGHMDNPEAWVETGEGVVTYADGINSLSRHQSGEAFDFQCCIPGRPDLSYDKIHMSVLIGVFLSTARSMYINGEIEHLLRSGADWNQDNQYLEPGTFADAPHLELIDP